MLQLTEDVVSTNRGRVQVLHTYRGDTVSVGMAVTDVVRKVFIFFYTLTVGLAVELVKLLTVFVIIAVVVLTWLVVAAFTVWQTYEHTHNAALTVLAGCGAVAGGYVVVILLRRLVRGVVGSPPTSSTDVLQLLLPTSSSRAEVRSSRQSTISAVSGTKVKNNGVSKKRV